MKNGSVKARLIWLRLEAIWVVRFRSCPLPRRLRSRIPRSATTPADDEKPMPTESAPVDFSSTSTAMGKRML